MIKHILIWAGLIKADCQRVTPFDDLEPYCTEKVLLGRLPHVLPDSEHKAIHKIGARYGAHL